MKHWQAPPLDPKDPMPWIMRLQPERKPRNYRYWKVNKLNTRGRDADLMKLDFNWGFGRDFPKRKGYRPPIPKFQKTWNF